MFVDVKSFLECNSWRRVVFCLFADAIALAFADNFILGRVSPITQLTTTQPASQLTLGDTIRYLEWEFLTQFKSSNIILLRPSMSFLLLQTPDPLSLREALPDFTRATHVFLPVNDCRNVTEAEGGTHWSLLLISVVDRIAFHYDSLPPGNQWEAYTATCKFGSLLNQQIRFINLQDSPVQENGSDCGVFVCLHMRHLLLKRLLMAKATEKVSMSLAGRKIDARAGRKEISRIIEGFRKEGERRRS